MEASKKDAPSNLEREACLSSRDVLHRDVVRKRLVYALIDPVTNELRYVGLTTRGDVRIREHLQPGNYARRREPLYAWIRSLASRGQLPEPLVVESDHVSDKELKDAERFWISYFRSIGCPLLNVTNGGATGPHRYPKGRRGLPLTEERKKAMYEGRKRNGFRRLRVKPRREKRDPRSPRGPMSEETKDRIRQERARVKGLLEKGSKS